MDGVFGRQRFTKGFNIIGFLSGVILVLLFGFFICAGEPVSLDDIVASWFFVCFGFFTSILCGGSLYVNRKAYIHVDAQGISGFFHFGLSLKCDFSDVNSVSYGGTGLRQHRINRQGSSARDFVPIQSFKNAGILYVFPIFETAEAVQKIR